MGISKIRDEKLASTIVTNWYLYFLQNEIIAREQHNNRISDFSLYIYIYIYIYRERERAREGGVRTYSIDLHYEFETISMNVYERKTLHLTYQKFFPIAFPLNSFSDGEITGNCIVLESEIKVSFFSNYGVI
jgi:hypothetical protein